MSKVQWANKMSITNFSGTPTYGHLWKAAIYDIADTLFGPEYIYMFVYNQNLWNVETPVFCKAERFSSPTVPKLYKDNPDAHLTLS